MQLIESLQWRYATKRFDPERKVSEEDLIKLRQAVALSASSFGLQPYRIVIVDEPETKRQLREVSYDQPQLTEASHVFVLAAKADMSSDYVEDYVRRIASTRGQEYDEVKGYGDYMKGSIGARSADFIQNWNKRQVYIALGTLLAAAAELRIDSCPMEGFQAEAYDRILGLAEMGLTATVILPVGYRSAEDATAGHKKVRLPEEELFVAV
jgi:nitroreductase